MVVSDLTNEANRETLKQIIKLQMLAIQIIFEYFMKQFFPLARTIFSIFLIQQVLKLVWTRKNDIRAVSETELQNSAALIFVLKIDIP